MGRNGRYSESIGTSMIPAIREMRVYGAKGQAYSPYDPETSAFALRDDGGIDVLNRGFDRKGIEWR